MKIMFITDSLTSGGVESQLVELATRLHRSQYQVEVVCLYGDKAGHPAYFAPRLVNAGVAVNMLNLALTPRGKLAGVYGLIHAVRCFRPHIVQAENYHANLLTRLARPFMPRVVRLIGTVRGNYTSKQLLYERLGQGACSAIVANGSHLRDQLVHLSHIPVAKVHYIPNGVDLSRFMHPQMTTELKNSITTGQNRLLLAVGRIHPEKQMHVIVEAFGLLKAQNRLPSDVRLAVIGKSQNVTSQSLLDAAIDQYSLHDIVTWYGEVDHIEAWYEAAEFAILFSPAEGLPNVALESMAAGRPVIISEGANAAGVIKDQLTGWVVPTGDVNQLANTLEAVLRLSSSQISSMRRACQAQAEEYSVTKMVERFEKLYSALTS